jgi:hypothetical protein
MRRPEPELTDEDLGRLARLGGLPEQIAEAAGIDLAQVCRRLAAAPQTSRSEGWTAAPLGDALSC